MLKAGKLDSDILQKIVIDAIDFKRPEVKVRAGIGEDCATIEFGPYDCVISTDPITAAVNDIGRLAINISCNDIASNGIEPLGITLAVMLPVGTEIEDIKTIMAQAGQAAKEAGVEIVGGHTEITDAVNKPVIVSTAFGRALSDASAKASDMASGDYILMTKWAGIEGTGIIACDKKTELKAKGFDEDELEEAAALMTQTSVAAEGVIAGKIGTHGMHDVTEGGILGAVWEMCHIAGLGCEVKLADIPVLDITKRVTQVYDIDWLRLISSGCMLIIASPDKKDEIAEACENAGIKISCIGRVKDSKYGIMMRNENGEISEIAPPAADELYKAV